MPKTAEEIAAEELAQKEHREQLAREANKKRNDQQLERRNAIADSADRVKDDEDDLQDLTDEVWDQADRPDNKPKSRAEQIAEQEAAEEEEEGELDEDEAAARLIRKKEAEDLEMDEARDAGAEDIRKNAQGVTEYQVNVNGKMKWLSLEQLRATAGKVEAADEYLREAKAGATKPGTQQPDTAAIERERQATERHAATKTKLKDLYSRASMGDEEAIDELAEIQAGLSRVTPDVLRIVDERVDARVVGRTSFEKAVEWFEGEYSEELNTTTLKSFAARRDKEIATENPDMDPRARLKKVGDEMRQIREDLGGTRRKTPASKADRKQGLPSIPSAAGRQRQAREEDEQESTQDTIRKMAQARGGRVIKHT